MWVRLSRECMHSHFRKHSQTYSYCKDQYCECWCHGRLNDARESGRKRVTPSNSGSTVRPGTPPRVTSVVSAGLPSLGRRR
jgi:hypothetical protein